MAETLILDRLVAASVGRQLYRGRRGGAERALLLLPRPNGSAPGWGARLEALAREAEKIRAAGFAPIEGAGAVEGVAALERPWVDGQPSRLLGRGKGEGLPPLLALLAVVDLATALERLHAAGLVHGDVSPESALVGPDGKLSLVEVGLGPALTGKAGSTAQDVQGLGRTLYLWLAGREAPADSREPLPVDRLPSRLDRRVPAQADALVLRALQAGGPRGLEGAAAFVASLRQVLRAAGAAVSSADIASWVASRAAEAVDGAVAPLLAPGAKVAFGPLLERAPAPPIIDTLVDFVAPALRPKPAGPAPRPVKRVDTIPDLPAMAPPLRPVAGAPSEATESSVSRSVTVQRRPSRRMVGGAAAVALVCGVVVLGYELGDRRVPARVGATRPLLSQVALPPLAPPAPPPAAAAPPLPRYDPNAPARPRPPPKRTGRERGEARLGRGAFLSLESNRVARVFVDGKDTRLLTPIKRLPISPGAHHIRLVAALGEEGSEEFRIELHRGATAYRYGKLGD